MKLDPTKLLQTEFARNTYLVNPPPETTLEDVLAPEFWSHVASKLRIGDHVEVVPEGMDWYAELIVSGVGNQWATVLPLHTAKFASAAKVVVPDEDKFFVKWGSSTTKFRVHRKADKAVLKDGFDTADLANAWVLEHKKTLAG